MSIFVSKMAAVFAQELKTLTHKKARLLTAIFITAVLFACSCYYSGGYIYKACGVCPSELGDRTYGSFSAALF